MRRPVCADIGAAVYVDPMSLATGLQVSKVRHVVADKPCHGDLAVAIGALRKQCKMLQNKPFRFASVRNVRTILRYLQGTCELKAPNETKNQCQGLTNHCIVYGVMRRRRAACVSCAGLRRTTPRAAITPTPTGIYALQRRNVRQKKRHACVLASIF